jgi:hypothetical protein
MMKNFQDRDPGRGFHPQCGVNVLSTDSSRDPRMSDHRRSSYRRPDGIEILSAQSCESPKFCMVDRTARFTGDFALHNSRAKVHSFAAIFAEGEEGTFASIGVSR